MNQLLEILYDKKNRSAQEQFFYCLALGFYFTVILLLSLRIILNNHYLEIFNKMLLFYTN
ncbi:hypothetical protein LEP1GSC041_0870 [Leptospira noguchii str. 2006001870]|nr:hypothetical protein LEP1GSC041_0870 [Leptospira noguchii str. 2006001870]